MRWAHSLSLSKLIIESNSLRNELAFWSLDVIAMSENVLFVSLNAISLPYLW